MRYTAFMQYVFLLFLMVLAAPVFAQSASNQIVIIQDDGSKKVIEIPDPMAQPEVRPEPQPERRVQPRTPENYVQPEEVFVPKKEPKIAAPAKPKPVKPKPAIQPKKPPPAKVDVAIPQHKPIIRTHEPKPAGQLIGKDEALYIALSEAPASSRVEVFERLYDDRPSYAVTFMTDQGPYEVIVDRLSAEVVSSGKATNEHKPKMYVPGPVSR